MKKYIALFLAVLMILTLALPAYAAAEEPVTAVSETEETTAPVTEEEIPAEEPAADGEAVQEESAEELVELPEQTPAEAPEEEEAPVETETPEETPAATEAPAEESEAEEPAADLGAAKDTLLAAAAVRPWADGDSASTCTVNYYDPSGTTLLHSEEVAAGGMPDALVGPYDNGSLIIYWATKAGVDLTVAEDWDYLCLPAFRSVSADTDYYAVYAPQIDGMAHAAFYVDDSWKLGGGTGKFFAFDWFPVDLDETDRVDRDYVDDYLRYMIFDAEDDFGGVHELYMSISWYENSALSGSPVDPANAWVSADKVFYGTMDGDYWFVYFLDENGDLAEAYPIEEGKTIVDYPGTGKSLPIGAYWEDQNGNTYTAAEIKTLAITEDLTLSPSQGPNGTVTPFELAQSLTGELASKLRTALGEPLSAVYDYQIFAPTGKEKPYDFTAYLYYDGFVVQTRKSPGFTGGEEYVIWVKELHTLSYYAAQGDSSPVLTQQIPSGDAWAFGPENRIINGKVVQDWTDADGQAVTAITADTALYPVYTQPKEGFWQVCFLSADGGEILDIVDLEKGYKININEIPQNYSGYYRWYTGPNCSGTRIDDPSTVEITGDTVFYGYRPPAGVIVLAREGGQQILSYDQSYVSGPGQPSSVTFQSTYDGYYDEYGNRTDAEIAVYAWKDEAGETVATVKNENGTTSWDSYPIILTEENQVFYAVEGWYVGYLTPSGNLAACEIVAKNTAAAHVPEEINNQPVIGWLDENGAAADLSQPITGHRFFTAVLGGYFDYKDEESGAYIGWEALPTGGKPQAPAPTSFNGQSITGWYKNGVFVDPAELSAPETVYAWYGLRLPADDGKAYINGMGDDTFAPQNSLTRAQAANILYKLLGVTEKGDSPCVFTDVSSGAWYYDAVTVLASHGILTGYADSGTGTYYFKPNQAVTRAEFVTMIARLFPERTTGQGVGFNDVSSTHWFRKAVGTASRNGWITGYEHDDGTYWFYPQNSITRAEAVTIVNRVLGRSLTESQAASMTMPFTDVATTHWAHDQVLAAAVVVD